MASALLDPPVATLDEVVARMRAIDAELDPKDGLACFNRMYLQVTELVWARVQGDFFADRDWMIDLDVVFANVYFDAVRTSVQRPDRTPRCWAPLLQHRRAPRVADIQFALAGMNAHINHDLPLAVATTCRRARSSPDSGSHHTDFDKVNAIIGEIEEGVRQSFLHGDALEHDRRFETVKTVVYNWSITEARNAAWTSAEVLWHLHRLSALERAYLDSLDGTIGLAGRGLLVPVA